MALLIPFKFLQFLDNTSSAMYNRITTVFLHSLEEAWQTVHPAAFITTTRPAPKNIP